MNNYDENPDIGSLSGVAMSIFKKYFFQSIKSNFDSEDIFQNIYSADQLVIFILQGCIFFRICMKK